MHCLNRQVDKLRTMLLVWMVHWTFCLGYICDHPWSLWASSWCRRFRYC